MDFSVVFQNLDYFLWGRWAVGQPGGLVLTVGLALASGVLALGLGIAAALAVFWGPRRLGRVVTAAADFVRAIPLLFVIFWIYFLIPAVFRTEVPGPVSVVVALAWFSAGAVMHTTLAGLRALPRGQTEAAQAAGLTRGQIFADVLAPQAFRNLIPSYVAVFASLIKDTSLAYVLNVPELTLAANQVNTRTQIHPAEIFLFTAAAYFALCFGLDLAARTLARTRSGRGFPKP